MRKCDRCGKGILVGMNVSHAHNRTKKRSYPNLHYFRLKTGSVSKRMRYCTKCLRVVKKQQLINLKVDNKPMKVEVLVSSQEGHKTLEEAIATSASDK